MATPTFEIITASPEGTVKVKYSIDNKAQTLSSMPVNDADALTEALNNYGYAYAKGLESIAPVQVAPEVTDLIGKKIEIVEPSKPEPVVDSVVTE